MTAPNGLIPLDCLAGALPPSNGRRVSTVVRCASSAVVRLLSEGANTSRSVADPRAQLGLEKLCGLARVDAIRLNSLERVECRITEPNVSHSEVAGLPAGTVRSSAISPGLSAASAPLPAATSPAALDAAS